jgi:hypothetical protein
VQEPHHAGCRGKPGDPLRSFHVNGIKALAALPADAHEVDDGLGVGHGRAHLVLAAEIGGDQLDALVHTGGKALSRLARSYAHRPAVLSQARNQMPADEP